MKELNQTNKNLSPFPTRKPETEKIVCDCGCTYFQQIKVEQFPRLHNISVGQDLPSVDGIEFYVLKCINCGEIIAPQTIFGGPQDRRRKEYSGFIRQLQELQQKNSDGEKV